MRNMRRACWWVGCAIGVALVAPEPRAAACGCLANPTPATPVVQAGERILFAHEDNQVVAYIQIQYSGSADEFGWLVPLPAVPTLELGTDELFTKLGTQTQPQYLLTTDRHFCGGGESQTTSGTGFGCGGESDDDSGAVAALDLGVAVSADLGSSPVVERSSIGPYDYAVLKADDQTEMLDWLQTNRYFIPTGTDAAVAPYIHPGAYFLALKLRGGQSTGDIVPVVLHYQSDLPMIPIILTQVGAVPNMGIQVWLLGEGRGVPRNYRHVVLDDMPIWLNSESYQDLVVRAVGETPQHHAFVTEYAGASTVMIGQLMWPGRFGDAMVLRALLEPHAYVRYLNDHGFRFDSTLVTILSRYLPEPPELVAQGIAPAVYYAYFDSYAASADPDAGAGVAFDAGALTDEIEMRVVAPTVAADALFTRHPKLTRLYTALSPEDMNADPVFGENRDLPDVPLARSATYTIPCSRTPWLTSADTNLSVQYPQFAPPRPTVPASLRIERLAESGPPIVEVDNHDAIQAALGHVDMVLAQRLSRHHRSGPLGALVLVGGALWLARRRSRHGMTAE